MTQKPDTERIAALTNSLAITLTATLVDQVNAMAREHGPLNAVTIAVDAALTAAVAIVQSALLSGAIEATIPMEDALRRRLDHVLALPTRYHFRQSDGSYDPNGVAVN